MSSGWRHICAICVFGLIAAGGLLAQDLSGICDTSCPSDTALQIYRASVVIGAAGVALVAVHWIRR